MNHKEHLYHTVFKTGAGWIGLLASPAGLLCSTLPQKDKFDSSSFTSKYTISSIESQDHFKRLIDKIRDYFQGHRIIFTEKLDHSYSSEFERSVWESARSVPFGETRSYGWLARQIGNPSAARAVGGALGRNHFPIIVPCHRILAINGSLHGFGGGLTLKQYLLNLEKKQCPVQPSGY